MSSSVATVMNANYSLAVFANKLSLSEVKVMVNLWIAERSPLILEIDLFAHLLGYSRYTRSFYDKIHHKTSPD